MDSNITTLSGILQSQITNADLDFQGDTGGALNITDGETLTISGGTNLHTIGSGNVLTVNTDDNLTVSGLTVAGNVSVGGDITVKNDVETSYNSARALYSYTTSGVYNGEGIEV